MFDRTGHCHHNDRDLFGREHVLFSRAKPVEGGTPERRRIDFHCQFQTGDPLQSLVFGLTRKQTQIRHYVAVRGAHGSEDSPGMGRRPCRSKPVVRAGFVSVTVCIGLLVAGCGQSRTQTSSGGAAARASTTTVNASVKALGTSTTTVHTSAPGVGYATPPRGFDPPKGSQVPASCTATPALGPVTPTPPWPKEGPPGGNPPGAVDSELAEQYPSVYGGLIADPPPNLPSNEGNKDFVILETERDPELESEAQAAYPVMTLSFQLTPRSMACLKDVFASVSKADGVSNTVIGAGIMLLTNPSVQVQTTACSPAAKQSLSEWFAQRWGDAVSLQFCGSPATVASGVTVS